MLKNCATCRYDPERYGICKRCVDFDQWDAVLEPTQEEQP